MPLLVGPSFLCSCFSLQNERRCVPLPSFWRCADAGVSSVEVSRIAERILCGKCPSSSYFLRGVSACRLLLSKLRVGTPWISLKWIDAFWGFEYWERSFSGSEGILQSMPVFPLQVAEFRHCLCLSHCGQSGQEVWLLISFLKVHKCIIPNYFWVEPLLGRSCPHFTSLHALVSWDS